MKQNLSPREMQVTELLAWGFFQKEVAHQLNISKNTVRTHINRIHEKMGFANLADLTRWYFSETGHYDFGAKPVLRKILAIFFLMLALSIEYFHIDAMRTRTVCSKTESISRLKGRRKKKKVYLFV